MEFKKRSFQGYLGLVARGMGMGAADVVPGVSGGTIALITGIYDELLHSLKQISPQALLVLKRSGIQAAWIHINGSFLISVFVGMLVSLKTFAKLITFALGHYPVLVWAFFFGLVLASIVYMGQQQKSWRWQQWLGLMLGTLMVYGVSVAAPAQLPGEPWILFCGGFVAICAMILPGISGSFLLLLAGLYPVFLAAINDLNLVMLGSFGAGCICGLLVFSRFLSWLLDRYHATTMAVLIGFLVGSLNVIWPWKVTVESTVDRHGDMIPLVQASVWPWHFEHLTGGEPMILLALTACAIGCFLVLSTEVVSAICRNMD